MFTFQQQKYTAYKRARKIWKDKAIITTRIRYMLDLSDRELKITMINTLKIRMGKVNKMHNQIILVKKLRMNRKSNEMLEIKNSKRY